MELGDRDPLSSCPERLAKQLTIDSLRRYTISTTRYRCTLRARIARLDDLVGKNHGTEHRNSKDLGHEPLPQEDIITRNTSNAEETHNGKFRAPY